MQRDVRLPLYVPLQHPTYDPFGPLAGYSYGETPWRGDPVRSHLRDSTFAILELCIDAYYVSRSKDFQGAYEFFHHWEESQHFLAEGADVNVCDDASGASSLHFAAGSGSEELCRLLLVAKARPDARDKRLRTPVWWAIQSGSVKACQALLEADARAAVMPSIDQMAPLHEAAFLGLIELVNVLLPFYRSPAACASALLAACKNNSPEQRPRRHAGVDVLGFELRTPLHVAASQGHVDICKLLVHEAADPQRACSHGMTALHYVVESGSGSRRLELCEFLAKCKPGARMMRDASGRTPLELAAEHAQLSPELRKVLQPMQVRSSARLGQRRPRSSAGRCRANS